MRNTPNEEAPELAGPEARITEKGSEAADDVSSINVRACAGQGQDVQRAYPQKNAGQSVCSGEAFVSRRRPSVSMEWRTSEALPHQSPPICD